ncbi:MAG: membrane protein insertase YidC [Methylococcaceae bacterium]|nr:membrane protein insertase YidC [Methylococcaceae bacterium]
MDNARFVLIVFFFFLSIMLYQQWQADYGPKPAASSSQAGVSPAANPDVPVSADSAGSPESTSAQTENLISRQRILVKTDVLRMEIDTEGGDIRLLELLDYPVAKDAPNSPVQLFTDKDLVFVAQNGFIGDEATAPNHHSQWQAQATSFALAEGQNELRVPLTWTSAQGVTVTKTYILNRGSYDVHLEQQVANNSPNPWTARQYVQLQRKDPGDKNKDQMVRTYTGGVLYTPEDKYKKITFKDMAGENLDAKAKDGWIAMIQHYFVAAWIPHSGEENGFYTKALSDEHFVIGAYTPVLEVPAGGSKAFQAQLFAGPKLQRVLEATAPGLELTVDYGALTIIAKPVFWLLEQFHKIFNNWGWAIIFVTLTLKALFFRLSAASYRSMANMRKMQPKLAELKERFGGDKQKLNHAMMEMYRKEKVNPLGGCLPILVQIPVFISLYWVLIETVEMRQAPFIGWLTDLSSKDPYFILPLLMGVSMFIQQRLSPPPADPLQAKIMQFFPVMFTGFFAFFPSGLVLYWVVNNVLSILQQWYINKTIGAAVPAKA